MYLSNDEPLVHLDSSMGFFDIFTIRSLKQSDIKIPNTMLCDEGEWKEWMFNSEKERTHVILRKHQENLLTIKVVRFFCHVLGCYEAVKQCLTVEQIYEKLQGNLRDTINIQAKVMVIYKSIRQPKLIRIVDLIKTLVNRNYAMSRCPDGWILIQETVQFSSEHEVYYYVCAEKTSEMANYRFNFLKRTVLEYSDTRIDEQNIFNLPERKDVTRILDQGLTHRQLLATLKLIDFLETNLRLSVRRIDLKMGINKSREPYLLAVLKLSIRIPDKFLTSGNIKAGNTLNIWEYLSLYQKLKNLPENEKKRKMVTEETQRQGNSCHGGLCFVTLKGDTDRSIQPSSQRAGIPYEQIKKVRKNIAQILLKLKDMNLIISVEENLRKKEQPDISEEQFNYSRIGSSRKVCKKCLYLYGIINKSMDFDTPGNSINKPNNFLSRSALILVSEGVALPFKINAKIVSKPAENQATSSTKNFLKLNKECFKNTFPLILTKTRPLSASLRKQQSNTSTKAIVTQSDRRLQTTKQDYKYYRKLHINKQDHKQQGHIPKTKHHSQSVVNIKLSSRKVLQSQLFITKRKEVKPVVVNKTIINGTLQAAKYKIMSSLRQMSATSVSELKEKFYQIYSNFLTREGFEVQAVQYLFADCKFPLNRRHIYSFENNTSLHDKSAKYHVTDRPTISLQKLSELCGCPEIIMKNNFIVDTLICDQKTSIIFCVLTSEMFGNEAVSNRAHENTIIIHDMFDCFMQYLQLAKDLLEDSANKRIILFNCPGQSYTLYDENVTYDGLYMCEIVDKLLYRLSEQLHLINVEHDDINFAGVGYGGYIVQMYTSINHTHYSNLKKILLMNTFTKLRKQQEKVLLKLIDLYRVEDKVVDEHAFLYYSMAINSTQKSTEQIENKMLLNPISVKGRSFILNNIIRSTYPVQSAFEQVAIPTFLVYSKENCLIPQREMHFLAHYQNNPTQKIPTRQLVKVFSTGHALMDDSPLQCLKHFEQFIRF